MTYSDLEYLLTYQTTHSVGWAPSCQSQTSHEVFSCLFTFGHIYHRNLASPQATLKVGHYWSFEEIFLHSCGCCGKTFEWNKYFYTQKCWPKYLSDALHNEWHEDFHCRSQLEDDTDQSRLSRSCVKTLASEVLTYDINSYCW